MKIYGQKFYENGNVDFVRLGYLLLPNKFSTNSAAERNNFIISQVPWILNVGEALMILVQGLSH
jgi:hypothetical protein